MPELESLKGEVLLELGSSSDSTVETWLAMGKETAPGLVAKKAMGWALPADPEEYYRTPPARTVGAGR